MAKESQRSETRRTILVTGATGHQGGTLARVLLERGHAVRAFTRFPASEGARRVEQLGAEICRGDFEDIPSLRRAMDGVDAVFAMGTPYEGGPREEVEEVKDIFDAAYDVGAGHVVYSSVASADQNTGIPFFESKHLLERELARRGLPYTIVAPVSFVENLWGMPSLRRGYFTWGIPEHVPLQQVALEDLAEVTAEILTRKDEFVGERVEVASHEITGVEAARVLSRVAGVDLSYSTQAPEEAARDRGEAYERMLRWLAEHGYQVDLPALRQRFPNVRFHSFEEWAREQDWGFLQRARRERRRDEGGAAAAP